MIDPNKAEFQFCDDAPFDWCETNAFSFNIPEANILGMLYVLTRPKLGVCMSDITIQDQISPIWEDQLYVDNRQHLPCPKSLLDYSLPNGLSVKCVDPLKKYRIDYIGIDDTELHFDCEALMPPFDINDPKMDPLAASRKSGAWAFNGHFELTAHIVGDAKIRGKVYHVDCYDTFDRSWSQRSEVEKPNAIWLHPSFGKDLTIHLLTYDTDPARSSDLGVLMSGYVLEEGELFGVLEATGSVARTGIMPMSIDMQVKDVRGKQFHVTGATISASRWQPYSTMVYPQCFMRWNYDGNVGYGVLQDATSRAYLSRHRRTYRLI